MEGPSALPVKEHCARPAHRLGTLQYFYPEQAKHSLVQQDSQTSINFVAMSGLLTL